MDNKSSKFSNLSNIQHEIYAHMVLKHNLLSFIIDFTIFQHLILIIHNNKSIFLSWFFLLFALSSIWSSGNLRDLEGKWVRRSRCQLRAQLLLRRDVYIYRGSWRGGYEGIMEWGSVDWYVDSRLLWIRELPRRGWDRRPSGRASKTGSSHQTSEYKEEIPWHLQSLSFYKVNSAHAWYYRQYSWLSKAPKCFLAPKIRATIS